VLFLSECTYVISVRLLPTDHVATVTKSGLSEHKIGYNSA